jgi:hypothetical protein
MTTYQRFTLPVKTVRLGLYDIHEDIDAYHVLCVGCSLAINDIFTVSLLEQDVSNSSLGDVCERCDRRAT